MLSVAKRTSGTRIAHFLLLGANLVLVIAGIGMIAAGAEGGVATTAFFGVCAAVSIWRLRPDLLESETRSAESVLAQYPGPIVLRASVKKLLFLAALSAGFGGVTLWMLLHEAPPMAMQVLLWPGVVLFLGGAPFLILVAIRGSALHLDGTSLAIVQVGRSRRIGWQAVSGFAVATLPGSGQRLVVFDDASAGDTRLVAMNRRLTGRGSGLPDSYGLDPEALATLLAAWRASAVEDAAAKPRWRPDGRRSCGPSPGAPDGFRPDEKRLYRADGGR